MAVVLIEPSHYEDDGLPEVCMKCGAPAVLRKNKQFSWYPGWIALTLLVAWPIFLILVVVLTKRRRMRVPLCAKHKNHWLWPPLITLSLFLVPMALGFAALILMDNRGNDTMWGVLCASSLIGFVAWLIVALIIQNRTIRPTQIDDDQTIRLVSVSPVFVDAYTEELEREESKRRDRRLDRSAGEKFGQRNRAARDEEDEEEEPERRVRRARDEDEEDEDDRDRSGRYRR
jgi:hypothetical protein